MSKTAGVDPPKEAIQQFSLGVWLEVPNKVLNIEPQNKKPQNIEVITSIFEISGSIFCGS